jgi:hypothetical protein
MVVSKRQWLKALFWQPLSDMVFIHGLCAALRCLDGSEQALSDTEPTESDTEPTVAEGGVHASTVSVLHWRTRAADMPLREGSQQAPGRPPT